MKQKDQQTSKSQLSPYNIAVKQAYFNSLKATIQLLATLERDELRYTLHRENRGKIRSGRVVHELLSPIIYLRLQCYEDGKLHIHFGFQLFYGDGKYAHITAKFIRLVHKLTSVEHTLVDIEHCINTNYIITECYELYDSITEENRLYKFRLIPHRQTSNKAKRILHVA